MLAFFIRGLLMKFSIGLAEKLSKWLKRKDNRQNLSFISGYLVCWKNKMICKVQYLTKVRKNALTAIKLIFFNQLFRLGIE